MKKSIEFKYKSIIVRYLVLILIAIPNLYLFYLVFTPLTVYPVVLLLRAFFEVSLNGNVLHVNDFSIQIIKACVAGSAYYLLLILNLSIPGIKIKKRLSMIGLSFAALLLLNILRIFALVSIYLITPVFFDITHKLFWYVLSTIFVILIWFATIRAFNITTLPVYEDLQFLLKQSKKKK